MWSRAKYVSGHYVSVYYNTDYITGVYATQLTHRYNLYFNPPSAAHDLVDHGNGASWEAHRQSMKHNTSGRYHVYTNALSYIYFLFVYNT